MNGQTICAVNEMALHLQQKLGSSDQQSPVDFESLIAQILGTAQEDASGEMSPDDVITALEALLKSLSKLDTQQDQDQQKDIDVILSQIPALFGEKLDPENILYKIQAEKIETLKSNVQETLEKLEYPKNLEEKALKEKMSQILEVLKTIPSKMMDETVVEKANHKRLKEQANMLTAARNYKSWVQKESQVQEKMDTKATETQGMTVEIEKAEKVISQNHHTVKTNPKYTLEAEKLNQKATSQELLKGKVGDPPEKKSPKESLKQPRVLSDQFQEVIHHKANANQSTKQVSEPEITGYKSKKAEYNMHLIEPGGKATIAENALIKEGTVSNKNIEVFEKIQNIDKIYTTLQKQVLQIGGKEKTTLTVKLQPEVLGKMKIQLEMVEGMVKGMIVVENESAKQALQHHLQDIKNQIKEQDIPLEGLEVNVNSEAFSESHQSSDEDNAFFNQRHDMKMAFHNEITEHDALADQSTQKEQRLNLLA